MDKPIQDGETVQPVHRLSLTVPPGSHDNDVPVEGVEPFVVRYQEPSATGDFWRLYAHEPGDPEFDRHDYWLDCDVRVVSRP